jgi:aryl-alcohol dehydrogenase-like predicted oxidoreductase
LTFGNEREYRIEQDDAKLVVDKALDLGINLFDTANSYPHGRSEEITGELGRAYHVEEAVDALTIRLSNKEISYLEDPYRPKAVTGHK